MIQYGFGGFSPFLELKNLRCQKLTLKNLGIMWKRSAKTT